MREKTYIRWINYVLGTQYMNQRATQLWEIGKLLQLDDAYWVRCNPDLGHLLEDYPPECADRDQTLSYKDTSAMFALFIGPVLCYSKYTTRNVSTGMNAEHRKRRYCICHTRSHYPRNH